MQDICVYFIVTGAAFYIGRTFFLKARGDKGCGGCGGGCASKTKLGPKPEEKLVQIDLGGSFKR